MQIRPLVMAKGIATFVPGIMKFACTGSGGTNSSRYCYSVWLRHLIKLREAGIRTDFHSVAELGPGDSLGIGLSAMLTGANRYFALDAVPHAGRDANIRTFDDLVGLFSGRAAIPGVDEFPEISPAVARQDFPIDAQSASRTMEEERIAAIRAALTEGERGDIQIRYAAPWTDVTAVAEKSLDLVFSQAVLEHVEDPTATYSALFRWLKPGAVMSHQIDFKSHGLTRDWWGHWGVSSWMWKLIRGRRPYLINRIPASVHLAEIRRAGFELLSHTRTSAKPPERDQLAAEFRDLSDEDLSTSGLFVIARRPLNPVR